MNVKELIEELKKLDEYLVVYTYGEHGDYVRASDAVDFITYKYDDYDNEIEVKAALVY